MVVTYDYKKFLDIVILDRKINLVSKERSGKKMKT